MYYAYTQPCQRSATLLLQHPCHNKTYGYGYGYGYGYVYGYGYGYGLVYGYGYGFGYGHVYGYDYGYGAGFCTFMCSMLCVERAMQALPVLCVQTMSGNACLGDHVYAHSLC
jgi:hypothetical protein